MNMFKMLKQAGSMQGEMKKIQKDLASKKAEGSAKDGLVKVVACGDMTIESIKIDSSLIDSSKSADLEEVVAVAVNDALTAAKNMAGAEMSKLTSGLGLDGLLGS